MKNNYSSFKNLENIHTDKNYIKQNQSLHYEEKVDINRILNRVKLNKKNEKKNILLKSCVAVSLVIFTIIITRF
tara:strand:+ start:327 stop:548 length:222 start_codon:yes stop_codon:yes gene_type:complete